MTKDQLNEWKNYPLTREVLAHIKAHRLVALEMLASPSRINNENFERVQAQLIGFVQGLDATLDIELEEVKENDNENAGA